MEHHQSLSSDMEEMDSKMLQDSPAEIKDEFAVEGFYMQHTSELEDSKVDLPERLKEEFVIKEEPFDERDMEFHSTAQEATSDCPEPQIKRSSRMAYHNTEELISEVEKRPALWDPSKEEYKNKNKKEEALLEVCRSIYQNYEEKTDEEKKQIGKELQTRWKSIRDAYIRNSKKLKDESKSGSGAVKTHRYVFAERLSFLRKVGENRETTDTLDPNHVPDDGTGDANQNLSKAQPKTSAEPKKRKRNLLEEKLIKFMDGSEEKEDDDKDFFMSMLPSVRTLNNEQKIEFRMQVLAALQNIRSGHRGHLRIQDSHPSPFVLPTLQSQYPHYPQYPSTAMTHPHFFGPPAATNIHPYPGNTLENREQAQPLAPSPGVSVPSPASYTSINDNSAISVNDFDIQ